MRRNYPSTRNPEKPFITAYHISEVPLPYYNPLEDPYLKGYFSNRKANHHLQQMGLVYKSRKQYPYMERRTKNGHKFLKLNLCETPSSHILTHRNMENRSCFVGKNEQSMIQSKDFDQISPIIKAKAQSEIFEKIGKRRSSFGLQKESFIKNDRKRNLTPDIIGKSSIFRRRNSLYKKVENAQQPNQIIS